MAGGRCKQCEPDCDYLTDRLVFICEKNGHHSSVDDIGISPVLLQAISQSITASSQQNKSPTTSTNMEPINTNSEQNVNNQMSERVSEGRELDSEAVKTMLKIKMAANALTKNLMNEARSLNLPKGNEQSTFAASTISDLAMANMLTALASQAGPTSLVSSNGGSHSIAGVKEPSGFNNGSPLQSNIFMENKSDELIQQTDNTIDDGIELDQNFAIVKREIERESELSKVGPEMPRSSGSDKTSSVDIDSGLGQANTRFIVHSPVQRTPGPCTVVAESAPISLNMGGQDQNNSGSIILPEQNQTSSIIDSSTMIIPNAAGQIIEIGGKKYILQPAGEETQKFGVSSNAGPSTSADSDIYSTVGGQEVVSMSDSGGIGMAAVQIALGNDGSRGHICPICGDEVSGFHYGIFTCESCKGFFKRTVQNKKSFVCHRQGECEITLENRKKCPACRFAKCLVMGMKLDAIRQDRSRGGRSSYSGLSPLDEQKRKQKVRQIRKPQPTSSPSISESHLASALSYDSSPLGKPFVPSVLTDIMNLESLLCDDDIPQNIKADDFISSNPNVFLTLLQLCELKLYKIVRWARNLPYFANISTDDQILLLQNCWCELLALTMCWKSIHLTNEIVFFHGQTIDLEKAKMLSLGDMFLCLLAEVEQLKRLKLDQYECVAMKVIILITPDIKGLNDSGSLSLQQQKISEALEQYTSSHYRSSPSKYGELLLRLPELSRISFMLKEQLLGWMPHDNTSCGLLYELLKGENMKELV